MLRNRMREELRKRELLQMLSNKSSDSTCTGNGMERNGMIRNGMEWKGMRRAVMQ